MNSTWRIRGGRIVDPATGRDETGDLCMAEGRIVACDAAFMASEPRLIDARGLCVVPGLIDMHVHLREPGAENAETIESGSIAAARGGFVAVVSMPNTQPPVDTAHLVRWVRERGHRAGRVRVLPAGCISEGRGGKKLADLKGMAAARAVAFSDDGATILDDGLMKRAMVAARRLHLPILDHALDPTLAPAGVMHEGIFSRKHRVAGIPSQAEAAVVERDIRLSAETGGAIHIQHVSARESVDHIRKAREKGLPVSAEVTPHHLALTDADIDIRNSSFKMSPPLRSEADRGVLLGAVADGTIEVLATDHAPHSPRSKSRGFAQALFGIVGLETAVGVTYTHLVAHGAMVAAWLRRWTVGPSRVLGLPLPRLDIGQPADLAILDLNTVWTVRASAFLSRSRNTPFEGRRLTGRAIYTFCGGALTWSERPALASRR